MNERIVCAAVKNKFTGEVVAGVRHYDEIMHKQMENSPDWGDPCIQGFITNKYRFVDREEAWKIALAEGQIIRPSPNGKEILYSENLY